MTIPPFMRERLERGIRERRDFGQSLDEILTWLGSPGTEVGYNPSAGEVLELLESVLGISCEDGENALRANEGWGRLMRLMDP